MSAILEITGVSKTYDADGDKDLFLTTLGANLLLQQQSPWHYENVAVIAGVEGSLWQDEEGRSHPEWSAAATWIDVDDDGLVTFGVIERFCGVIEGVVEVARSQHNPWELAMSCVQREE